MASLALAFDILAKDNASRTFQKVGNSADDLGKKGDGLGKKFGGLGKVLGAALGGAALAGVVGLGAAFANGVKDAASYQKITDQLAQTLKSTGNAAGTSVDKLKKYAGELESLSGVDEELILNSQNVLATFTQIRNSAGKNNDIFDQASKAALNLSVTLGGDLAGATVQVGKALNDPIKGVTALTRSGVSFTQQQKDQIKTLQESGNVLGAQKIILSELEVQFGGAAEAAGKGLTGSIARAKDAFGDLFRTLATPVLPVLAAGMERLAVVISGPVASGLARIGEAARVFFQAISGGSELGEFEGRLRTINDAGVNLRDAFLGVLPSLKAFVDRIGAAAREVLPVLGNYLTGSLLPAFKALAGFIVTNILPVLAGIASFIVTKVVPAVVSLAQTALAGLRSALASAQKAINDNRPGLEKLFAILKTVAGFILASVVPVLKVQLAQAFAVIGTALGVVIKVLGQLGTGLTQIAQFFVKTAKAIVGTIASILEAASKVPGIGDKFKGAAEAVRGVSNDLAKLDRSLAAFANRQVTVGVNFTAGTVRLPNGTRYNAGQRAAGGPVAAGQPYVVGERRAEVFVPNQAGTIRPSTGMGGGGDIVIQIDGREVARAAAPFMPAETARASRRG